jgi:hypothetical protein
MLRRNNDYSSDGKITFFLALHNANERNCIVMDSRITINLSSALNLYVRIQDLTEPQTLAQDKNHLPSKLSTKICQPNNEVTCPLLSYPKCILALIDIYPSSLILALSQVIKVH